MPGSRILRRLGRRIAARVARRVANDDLFEKAHERPPQPPVFTSAPTPTPVPAPAPAPAPEPAAAAAAPPAEAPALGEGCVPVELGELQALLGEGRGLRVVNHWATWCDPCVEELPLLADLHARLGERAAFLGVSWDLFEGGRAAGGGGAGRPLR